MRRLNSEQKRPVAAECLNQKIKRSDAKNMNVKKTAIVDIKRS